MRRVLSTLAALVLALAALVAHAQAVLPNGARYTGEMREGRPHGNGRAIMPSGEIFEGEFVAGELTGEGTYNHPNGARYRGTFVGWKMHGTGRFVNPRGEIYEGEVREGFPEGQGRMRMPNGDEYRGGFVRGQFEGQGTVTYARPQADGSTQTSGVWRKGRLETARSAAEQAALERGMENLELALLAQRPLLDGALAGLAPTRPGRISMYLLAVAGDGTQEVFRREVEFVRSQFDRDFGTRGRSVALVNSRNTASSAPMATRSSLREALRAIAAKMNRESDILFLFLTSHGTAEPELRFNQDAMLLRGLRPAELAALLRETGVRWKAVVVSACYSGGFLGPLRDEHTLVITASRHDRASFGCADDNDFTYFGRAFFKEGLAAGGSFDDAFRRAEALVAEWEARDRKGPAETSLPQIHSPRPMREHLQRWWSQK